MKNFTYLVHHFFTHKDFLAPANEIPGTLFTPLHFAFASVLLALIIAGVVFVVRHPKWIKPVFIADLAILVVWEVVIITWESVSGRVKALDLASNLPLYPCSLFMYTMPFAIWGGKTAKKIACGYICTLGLIGASVNFFYPAMRLSSYSCFSFVGFHTFFYHGSMLFTCLVMFFSGFHRFTNVKSKWELFYPCIPTLLLSIPANLVNYSPVNSDYMFFKGQFPLVAAILPGVHERIVTMIFYLIYIFTPALFYLPSYLSERKKNPSSLVQETFLSVNE